jgi:phenylalanyl-tRNA synthetase beta chain
MPTITIDLDDLRALTGIPIGQETIIETLQALKCEAEDTSDGKLTLEVTSDRPDLFSTEGIARAVRSYNGGGHDFTVPLSARNPLQLSVHSSVSTVRPFIVASALFGVSLSEESLKQTMQLQEKLHNTYGQKRRKASIGVYDLDKVRGDFIYAALPPEEISFIPLDAAEPMDGNGILERTPKGREYANIINHFKRYPLLSDSEGTVLSMPPILNSEDTRVTTGSKNLLIDVTGTEEKTISNCLNIMVTSVLERGGEVGMVDVIYSNRRVKTPQLGGSTMVLRKPSILSTSGLDLGLDLAANLLRRMGLKSDLSASGEITVAIPPYRIDIMHEVDLVEDLIMAYGLNNILPVYPKVNTIGKPLPGGRLKARARDLMIGMGFQEISTYLLGSKEVHEVKSLCDPGPHVEIIQPLSSEYAILRGSLTPKLLQFLGDNKHCAYPQKIFEYGDVVDIVGGIPVTFNHLAAAIADSRISFEDIQAVAAALFKNLSGEIKFSAAQRPPLIEGRTAEVTLEGRKIGMIGEALPTVLVSFGIESPVGLMELDMSSILGLESLSLT